VNADTRARILETATDLFTVQGYEKTSLREIAERVGVTKAALYYYFPGKDDLLRALLDPLAEVQAELIERLQQPLDRRAWGEGIALFVDWLLANPRLFRLLEHNRGAIMAMSHESDRFEAHLELHRCTEAALADPSLPVEDRVRMACALGVAGSLAGFGGPLVDEDIDKVRAVLHECIAQILDLPPESAP
jgi:AcrR family transcriptional regulator